MACLAVVLWVLGFEVAPNLHLGLHDHLAPHSHDGVVAQAEHAHDHHDADHGHAHDDAPHHHPDDAGHHPGDAAHHHDDHHASPADSHESAAHEPEFADSDRHDAADDARDAPAASRLDPSHGDHDLLHRGVAIATPPIAQPSIAQAPVSVLARLHSLVDRPSSRAPLVLRARGPPTIADVCRAVDCTA